MTLWESNFSAIAQNVIASFVWLLLGLLVARAYAYLHRGRHFRRVWQIPGGKKIIDIAVASLDRQETGVYSRPATGLGELLGAARVNDSLIQAYGRGKIVVSTRFSSQFPSSHLDRSVVSIGGPRHNSVTRLLDQYMRPRYKFLLHNGTEVLDTMSGARYKPDMVSEVKRDYALVYRLQNPFNKNQAAFVLSGAHTYGVSAAAKIFTNSHVKELSKAIRRLGPSWEVMVQVECIGDEDFPSIIAAHSLKVCERQLEPNDPDGEAQGEE